jgi:hypothetical protein
VSRPFTVDLETDPVEDGDLQVSARPLTHNHGQAATHRWLCRQGA